MTTAEVTTDDLDQIVELLARRRESLVGHAPIFWRPADDAAARHGEFLRSLLTNGGAQAFRTEESVLFAARHRDGWLVDDLCVPGEHWDSTDGRDLWNALDAACHGDPVLFVCPTYERERGMFAESVGLRVVESWWLLEIAGSGGGEPGTKVPLPGAHAVTVGAPPVYAPPGPMLFLPGPITSPEALSAAISKAPACGCAGVVVNQRADDEELTGELTEAGYRRHCDYYTGKIQPL